MKTHYQTLFIFILFIITFNTQSQVNYFTADLFEIQGPVGWDMKEDQYSWLPVEYSKSMRAGKIPPSIKVTYAGTHENMVFIKKTLQKQIGKVKIIEEGEKQLNENYKAQFIIYTFDFNNFKLKGKSYLIKEEGKLGILLGFTALESNFDLFVGEFEETAASIEVFIK